MKTYKDYGAPTNTTPGNEGDLYIDMNTGEVYRCYGDKTEGKDQGFVTVYAKERSNTTYNWSLVGTSVPAPGPGGDHECTGVSSWNDLTDKPFGEVEEEYTETTTVTEEMTVEWDGVIGDRMYVGIPDTDTGYVHLSDAVIPNAEAAIGATVAAYVNGSTQETVIEDSNAVMAAGPALVVAYTILNIPEDNTTLPLGDAGDVVFPKKGLYASYSPSRYGASYKGLLAHDVTVTKTRTVIEYLDPKYIKDMYHEYEEEFTETKTETVTEEMTIEWDGTIDENAVLIEEILMEDRTMAAYLVHVSDATISTKEDAVGATFATMDVGGTAIEGAGAVPEEGVAVIELEGGTIITCGGSANEQPIYSVSADNLTLTASGQSITFPKKGLYFMAVTVTMNGETASGGVAKYVGNLHHTVTETITHSETKIKTIDPKFLPEPLAYEKSETVTKTELTTINLDDISDRVVATGATMFEMPMDYILFSEGVIATVEDVATMDGNIFADGQDNSINSMASAIEPVVGEKYISIGGGFVVSVFEDNTTVEIGDGNPYKPLGTVTFPKKGVYCMYIAVEGTPVMYTTSLTANLTFTATKTEIKKLDPKFLPDTIEPKELIIASSTEGSTKRFKITVADDGTVSAVEVTA